MNENPKITAMFLFLDEDLIAQSRSAIARFAIATKLQNLPDETSRLFEAFSKLYSAVDGAESDDGEDEATAETTVQTQHDLNQTARQYIEEFNSEYYKRNQK